MNIKLVWRTDVHLSDRSPASRTDDWMEAVFTKLDQTKLVAGKVGAQAILDGGDFFHIKSPSRNSHDLVRRVADHHADYPCPVFCTPGNHDSVYGDYANLGQQPLGVLYSTGVFKRLYDQYELYVTPSGTYPFIRKVPGSTNTSSENGHWVSGGIPESVLEDTTQPIVRVVGIPYHGKTYDLERFATLQKGEEDYLICVAHVLASTQGGTMFEGEDILMYKDLAPMAPDLFMFGHWHKDQGVQEIDGTKFVNIGSLTRGSLSQDNVKRRPAIALLTIDRDTGIHVQVLRLRVKDADEVFDMESRVREEARDMTVDAFVESVREALVETKSTSVEESIEKMAGVLDVVRERALEYMELVG